MTHAKIDDAKIDDDSQTNSMPIHAAHIHTVANRLTLNTLCVRSLIASFYWSTNLRSHSVSYASHLAGQWPVRMLTSSGPVRANRSRRDENARW